MTVRDPAVTSTSNASVRVRARVVPGAVPDDLLHDPLVEQLVKGGPLARERFASRWSEEADLRALGSKRAPLSAPLVAEMSEYHRRLGASPASLAALERLAKGEAVCTVAGQQPAPLGGPLYSLHKIAATVGLARVVEERGAGPCVPLYWMHGEDSDFHEIRAATCGGLDLALHDLALPAELHREGGLVGNLPAAPLAALHEEALACWAGLAGEDDVRRLLERALANARDLGEATSALFLALFAGQGLVVVDPRLPAFRAAARPLLDRYLARATELAGAARSSGSRLEAAGARRALADAALDSFVFAIDEGARSKVGVEEARAAGAFATLSPSVALRPAVQDAVFPTVAMACGPGEIAYLAQLREVFEGLGVRAACPVPRFGATWLPPAAIELLDASQAEPWELVIATDAVLRRMAESQVPDDVRAELARVHADAMAGFQRYAEAARAVDASLPQMVESARAKVDYQFTRLFEGLAGKMRQRLERRHPEWLRVRYYLLPSDKLQERRLASLEPVARRGAGVIADVCDLAAEHARRLATGVHEHWVVEL